MKIQGKKGSEEKKKGNRDEETIRKGGLGMSRENGEGERGMDAIERKDKEK